MFGPLSTVSLRMISGCSFRWLLLVAVLAVDGLVRADDAANEAAFREQLQPLLRTYCFDCHGSEDEIALDSDQSSVDLRTNRNVWMRAMSQVRNGTMPPEDGPSMDAPTRIRLASLIDQLASAVDCVRDPNAGKVAIRRLNRAEYRNTIRDLTGVDYAPAEGFPGDDVGYGFDNIGDVLSLPPLLVEKYLDAAVVISGKAIHTPPPPQIYEIDKSPGSLINADKFGGGSVLNMNSQGTVSLQSELPFAGMYTLTITARGDQGGNEPVRMLVESGRNRQMIDVPSSEDQEYKALFRLGKGARKIDISFVNDFYEAGKADRNLHLVHVNLRGEESRSALIVQDELPAWHRKLVFVTPNDRVSPDQASATVLARLASRAYRRPASKDEIDRLVQLAAQIREAGGSYEEGLQVALQAILVSPHFLFRVERPATEAAKGSTQINQYELASRISYFLWSSMPDDELLLLAHQGQLRDRKKLLDKVARMMQDPRANQFVENFAGQWLQLRNLDLVNPDTRIFRAFDDDIRQLMRRETLTFFAGVMRENLPITTLIDADFTYLNEPLAQYYGIRGVTGDNFRRVSLAGTPRGGLLTHASVLTVTSNPTRTSPVKRGKWILDNLLNTPPPPAPPNVPELDKGRLVGTLRQRMEQHRQNPACAACHNMMDPLGFALENFDGVGQWRTRDGRDEVDASGSLPDGTEFRGVEELRQLLVTERKEQFTRALAEKMLIYAIGRGTEYYDKCAVDQIVDYVQQNDHKFAYLIAGIIASDPFQKQGYRE
jgi:hypothetical protein